MDQQQSQGTGAGNKATKFLHTLTGWLHGSGYGAVEHEEEGEGDESPGQACMNGGVIKGFVPVYVGMAAAAAAAEEEAAPELQRFMVKLKHLEHPLFRKLLELREEELGFCDNGKLVIPCDASLFQSVLWHIESNHKSAHDVDRLLASLTSTCIPRDDSKIKRRQPD